jgi:hypothetical protein
MYDMKKRAKGERRGNLRSDNTLNLENLSSKTRVKMQDKRRGRGRDEEVKRKKKIADRLLLMR